MATKMSDLVAFLVAARQLIAAVLTMWPGNARRWRGSVEEADQDDSKCRHYARNSEQQYITDIVARYPLSLGNIGNNCRRFVWPLLNVVARLRVIEPHFRCAP
jgi:hypothetical protein